jgi:hypothetical protein
MDEPGPQLFVDGFAGVEPVGRVADISIFQGETHAAETQDGNFAPGFP